MGHLTISRGLRIIRHLKTHSSARFTDLYRSIDPILGTALANLLRTLCQNGEIQKKGREYALRPGAALHGETPQGIYGLSEVVRQDAHPVLETCNQQTTSGCAFEYRREVPTILRLVVPVKLPGETWPHHALRVTANAVYLIETEKCIAALREAAEATASVLAGRVPLFGNRFQRELPERSFDDPWPTIRAHTRQLLPLTRKPEQAAAR